MIVVATIGLGGCVWPAFRFGPALTGDNPFETTLGTANVTRLGPAWSVSTGTAPTGDPVVGGNRIVVSDGSKLLAFDTNGSPVWSVDNITNGTSFAAADPTIDGDGVWSGSFLNGSGSNSGSIDEYDVANGVRLRTFAAVAALGGATVAQYVYDWFNASGYVAWGAVPVSPGAGFISTSGIAGVPTVGGGHVFAPGAGGTLEGGFDASGASCPPDRISGVRICSPAWTANIGANLSPIAYAGSTIYTGASNGNLYAFASNGCTMSPCPSLWIGTTGGALTAPAVANGLVYVGSADGRLYAFDAAGCGRSACAPIWSMTTHASVSSAPSVANGVVYVGSDDGRLYAVAASGCGTTTCAPLWRSAPGAAIRTAPAIAGGTVSVGRIDGSLTAYRTRT